MLVTALEYLKKGYSVIPLHKGSKIPVVKWMEFQKRLPTVDEISDWFSNDCNLGFVTGAISNLVVIDVDTLKGGKAEKIYDRFPTELIAKTGNGYHFYYKHPGWHVDNAVALEDGIDVRGDGGYVVAPPSVHPNGAIYRWLDAIPQAW